VGNRSAPQRNKCARETLPTIQKEQLEIFMRYGLYIAGAAALLMAVPAAAGELRAQSSELSSQVVIEGPGVGVRVGPDRERERWRERRGWRDREVRGEGRGCKTVTVKERGPDGSMVTRTRSNC
jgi:hypothetical protein